jgi:hypothetical protein
MIKIRTTQSFKDAITEARRIFGVEHELIDVVNRALRWFKSSNMSIKDIPKAHGKGIGNPTTIRAETELNNNQLQMVVILFIREKIEKSGKRRIAPLVLDESCEVYNIIENKGE